MNTENHNGSIAAALLASGIGSLALGVFVVLAEASPTIKTFLTIISVAGPLSGKTTYAILIWILSWIILYFVLRNKDVRMNRVAVTTFILIALGFIATFPPFFLLFE